METPVPAAAPSTPGTPGPAPRDYRTAGAMLFAAGLTTSVCALILAVLLAVFGLFLCCCCLGFFPLPGLILGVITAVCGWRAMHGRRVRNLRLVNALALGSALLCGDLVGLVLNVLALIWLANFEVSAWIESQDEVASRPHAA